MTALIAELKSSSFDSTPGCSINRSKQACKVKAIHRYAMGRQASEVHILGCTIHDTLKNHTNVFNKGMQCLLSFIEHNASIELQKAFSIVIMGTAITSWNEMPVKKPQM